MSVVKGELVMYGGDVWTVGYVFDTRVEGFMASLRRTDDKGRVERRNVLVTELTHAVM